MRLVAVFAKKIASPMKYSICTVMSLFALCQPAPAQNEPVLAWLRSEFVETISLREPEVEVDASGNVLTITNETWQNPFIGFLLVKYDSLGNKLWERRYEGGIWDHTWQGFTLDQEGNAYVSINYGGGLPGYLDDAILLKYAPNGDLLWELNYGQNFVPDNTVAKMHADTGGLLYLFGMTYQPGNPDNVLFTACLNQADGSEIWRTEYPGQFWCQSMRLLADRIEVFATQYQPNGRYNLIQQVDLQGNIIQTHAKPDLAYYQTDFNHIMADGSIIYGNRGFLYSATRVDAQGDTLWHYHLPNNDGGSKHWVRDITEDEEMNVYLTGGWTQPGSYIDMVTTKLSPDGEVLWQHVFSNQGDSLTDSGDGILVDEQFVYAIGYIGVDSTNSILVILIYERESGELVHSVELDTISNSYGNNLASYSGGVVFCGQSHNGVSQSTSLLTGRIILSEIVRVEEKSEEINSRFIIYPNPANAEITIISPTINQKEVIQMIDLAGQTVMSIKPDYRQEIKVNLRELPTGIYFVKIGEMTEKFLIVR